MEELQLPKSIELESQTLRPVDTAQQVLKSHSHSGRRMSVSDSHIQIHSKTPTWNEQHMIYQLDFGGRVTTKSAKNFQLELNGEQVGGNWEWGWEERREREGLYGVLPQNWQRNLT